VPAQGGAPDAAVAAVLLAMGNWLSDKYAEGTIGRRLYAGCEMVDRVESIAAGHARALFGADHAYAQPHSGIDANLVAFWAILARRVEEPSPAGKPRRRCLTPGS
jgi:glycine hydroxymethyltransferase